MGSAPGVRGGGARAATFCPQVLPAVSAPAVPWARTSGSALGGRTGPAAPSQRSTEALGPNTSCPQTLVPATRAGLSGVGGGQEEAGAVSEGTGVLNPGLEGGRSVWGVWGAVPGAKAAGPRGDAGTPRRLLPTRPVEAPRPRLHLWRASSHTSDFVRPRAQPPGAGSHDRARPRRHPRLLHLRPPAPRSALPHSRTGSGPLGPRPPRRRAASRKAHQKPYPQSLAPFGYSNTPNSVPSYPDVQRTPSPT